MKIAYPYNEILPKRSAHDVYIARNCSALAESGCDVTLLCGSGSLADTDLAIHYCLKKASTLHFRKLPIIRKNYGLPFNWNPLFFWSAQRYIERERPDWVAMSVLKQGAYHLAKKVPGVCYVYEVHELSWYPGRDLTDSGVKQRFKVEQRMLSNADAVTVTTEALKNILVSAPYNIRVPIAVVPLAVDFAPLPAPPPIEGDLHLMYVGQMYQGQGVDLLLKAFASTTGIRLTLVGGKPDEIGRLKQLAASLGLENRVEFAGFRAPAELPELVAKSHVLIAPFSASGRMPYVAHTKLLEYAAWQRPVVAPDLPVVREHFPGTDGWVPFVADSESALAEALRSITVPEVISRLYDDCRRHRVVNWSERSAAYLDFLKSILNKKD